MGAGAGPPRPPGTGGWALPARRLTRRPSAGLARRAGWRLARGRLAPCAGRSLRRGLQRGLLCALRRRLGRKHPGHQHDGPNQHNGEENQPE